MNTFQLICKLLTGIVLLPSSCLMMSLSIYFHLDRISFLETAVKTNGKVIELVRPRNNNKNRYIPKYIFTDNNGDTYTGVNGGVASNPPLYWVGETVEVIYDPKFPNKSEIDDGSSLDDYLWFMVIFLFYGFIPFIYALSFLLCPLNVRNAYKITVNNNIRKPYKITPKNK